MSAVSYTHLDVYKRQIFGLIVALILQLFYNYILAKMEALTSEREDSSISLLDMVIKYDLKYKK